MLIRKTSDADTKRKTKRERMLKRHEENSSVHLTVLFQAIWLHVYRFVSLKTRSRENRKSELKGKF